jgi:hypothetical protein
MTKPPAESGNPIDRLLQDRAQFVNWLTRLNSSGGDGAPAVPETVRSRVRADYERRLEAVLEELRGHTAQIEEQVADLTARRDLMTERDNQSQEQLAEAEVRHMVGEYDETIWEGIRAEKMKVIVQVREELTHTTREIDRLTDVLNTIRTPVVSSPAPTPAPAPAPTPPAPAVPVAGPPPVASPERPVVVPVPAEPPRPAATGAPPAGGEIPLRPGTPRPQPKLVPPKKEEGPSRTLWFPSGRPHEAGQAKLDELAFLKSVTGGDAPSAGSGPAPTPVMPKGRTSGGFVRPAAPAPEPAPPPPVREAAPASRIQSAPAAPAAQAAAPAVESAPDRPSTGVKTLKCADCGTLNRPTEWYCERCGAELAAL